MAKAAAYHPNGELWTVKETADWFKVGQRTVYRWIKKGKLFAVDYGSKDKALYRIPKWSALDLGSPTTDLSPKQNKSTRSNSQFT